MNEETETAEQRQKRKAAEKRANEARELEIAFARRHELMAKNLDNSELAMVDSAAALRKKRIAELVANEKRQNYYRWAYELHQQKKYKEKNNGRVN